GAGGTERARPIGKKHWRELMGQRLGGGYMSIRKTTTLAAMLLQSACGPPPSDCESGEHEACPGETTCVGSQAWSSDTRTPPDGTSQGGGGGTTRPGLPTQCRSESECPAASTCFSDKTEDGSQYPPPPGMCVADCSVGSGDCSDFSNAVCVDTLATTAYCVHSCEIGSTDASKCGAREDSACHPLEPGVGYCSAVCTSHEQCEEACSARAGRCTSGAAPGFKDFGSECDPDSPESCSGICVEVEPGYAVCSNPCVFGSAAPCALDANAPSLCA